VDVWSRASKAAACSGSQSKSLKSNNREVWGGWRTEIKSGKDVS
jgi:hypothetical protein